MFHKISINDYDLRYIVLTIDNIEYLISYYRVIACKQDGKIYLDSKCYAHSSTTGKHRNRFLGEKLNETRLKIASGEYILCNLNS